MVHDKAAVHSAEEGDLRLENAEAKRRRLALFDGLIEKRPADLLIKEMRGCRHPEEYFVFFDRNHLFRFSDQIADMPFLSFASDSAEMQYMKARREALGGYLPSRRRKSKSLPAPPLSTFQRLLDSSGERMNAKIRKAQLQKIPYMLVLGDKEATEQAVSVRLRNNENLGAMPLSDFIERITPVIASRYSSSVVSTISR